MKLSKLLVISITSSTLFVTASASLYAASMCEGQSNMTAEQQHALPVNEANGHMLLLMQDSGPMKSTGLFGDGSATDQGMNRLYQGNGEGQGYYTIKTDEGTSVAQWQGTVSTVVKDGVPNTSFKGTWKLISGSGKFENIKGRGVYDGYFTSESTRVINWKGTCTLASQ